MRASESARRCSCFHSLVYTATPTIMGEREKQIMECFKGNPTIVLGYKLYSPIVVFASGMVLIMLMLMQ